MTRAGLWAGAFLAIASAQSAMAAGPGDRKIEEWSQRFEIEFEPLRVPEVQMRRFRAEGSTALPNGMTTSHDVVLGCVGEPLPCVLAGTLVGPLGQTWDFSGDIIKDGTQAVVELDVYTPDGRTVPITIAVSRDKVARLYGQKAHETCSDPLY